MAITRGPGTIYKLAADAKPTASLEPAGMHLRNTDDKLFWINSGTDWIVQDFIDYKKFHVHKDGANYYITDINHRVVGGPSTDIAAIVNAHMLTQGVTAVWEYLWDAATFTMQNPLIIPSTVTGIKKYIHQGQGVLGRTLSLQTTTCVKPSATFPTNRYFFELNNPVLTTADTGYVKIDSFQGVNEDLFTTKNVGFVKFEAGADSNGYENWVVSNCHTQYLWRNLHLIGKVWHGRFENLNLCADNASFSGDCDILLEDGGHTGATNTTPKDNKFYNIRAMHSGGQQVDSIRMKSGGYNVFRDIFIDGFKYSHALISLDNTDGYVIHDNTFDNIITLDLSVPSPDNRQAALYLAGTSIYDNFFRKFRSQPWTETVKIVGTGVVRNDIEIVSFWGVASRVTDTGTDGTNVIRILGGAQTSGVNAAIVWTGGVSTIIDDRRGSTGGGSRFLSGDGTNKIFPFAHNMFTAPAWVMAAPGDAIAAAAGPMHYTWDATNITVTFMGTAPPSGSSNFRVRWRAGVYI